MGAGERGPKADDMCWLEKLLRAPLWQVGIVADVHLYTERL